MSTQNAESHESDARVGESNGRENESTGPGALGRAKRAVGDGTAALLAGGVLILNSLRRRGRGGRAVLLGSIGLALIGIGVRQRLANGGEGLSMRTDDEGEDASTEVEGTQELHDLDQQAAGNPRDVSKEPDVETAEDEGDVQFTREQDVEPREEPDLDEGVEDPRHDESVDEEAEVEVDISKAAMADEPNEAAGPTSTQSQPTTTKDEDTVPEDAAPVTEDASEKQAESDDESEDDSTDDPNEDSTNGSEDESADDSEDESGTEN